MEAKKDPGTGGKHDKSNAGKREQAHGADPVRGSRRHGAGRRGPRLRGHEHAVVHAGCDGSRTQLGRRSAGERRHARNGDPYDAVEQERGVALPGRDPGRREAAGPGLSAGGGVPGDDLQNGGVRAWYCL